MRACVRIAALVAATLSYETGLSEVRAQEVAFAALDPISEDLRPAARISGRVVAGVMVAGNAAALRPHVEALVPASWAGSKICLRLHSSDGRYEGSRSYQAPEGWLGGRALFRLQSAFDPYLTRKARDSLAVLVRKGTCSDPDVGHFALASWNETPPQAPAEIFLLLNTYRADETYVLVNKQRKVVHCGPTNEAQRLAFDVVCKLSGAVLSESGQLRIEINRIRKGNFEKPIIAHIDRK